MENPGLYEDDLTEEREPTPEERDEVSESETLDPESTEPLEPVKPPKR